MNKKYTIGVDVGGTKIAYGLFDEDFQLLIKKQEASMPSLSALQMMDEMTTHIDALLNEYGVSRDQVRALGAAFPCHIDFKKGIVITAANLPNWSNVPVKDEMEKRLSLPVFIDNDANVAVLAEVNKGAAKGLDNAIYITISTGVGSGLYLDGKIYRGTYGAAGEVGHALLDTTTRIHCGCGQVGCVECTSSGTGMVKYVKVRLAEGEKSIIPQLAGGLDQITPYFIGLAEKEQDALAIETLEYSSTMLAKLFATLFHIFSIDTIVYGGGTSKIGEPLMGRISEKIKKLVPMTKKYPLNLVQSYFGDDVSIFGAAMLVDTIK